MNTIRQLFLTTVTTLFVSLSYGQSDTFTTYKYEQNDNYTKLNFSFDIPTNWKINPETVDGTGYFLICTPNTDSIAAKYTDCLGGLIFRVKFLPSNLETALLNMGLQKKDKRLYITEFKEEIKILYTTDLNESTYKGIYYTISHNLTCKSMKKKKTKGEYQFIYFSNGSQTIIIETNGAKLDDIVFKRIIDTFTFY